MSVLIKGMEMPNACPSCPFVMAYYCLLIGISDDNEVTNYINKRHPNCPLVDVPAPHGRLVDADNIYTSLDGYLEFTEREAPTIIEAESEE